MPEQPGRARTPDEERERLDNHYGYCTLPPDHDGPCASGRGHSSTMTHEVRVEPVMGDDDIARVTLWCQTCKRDLYESPLLFADPDVLVRDAEAHRQEAEDA